MDSAIRIEVVHTAALGISRRTAARELLYAVFDDLTDADWEHCLGGMHALALAGDALVGHAAVVGRRLGHAGRPLRVGYVEGVAVRADHRGRGIGSALMAPLEQVISDGYELGALAATDDGARFYAARGWTPWAGRTWALSPGGVTRTDDEDDCVLVRPGSLSLQALDLTGDLIADWRDDCAW